MDRQRPGGSNPLTQSASLSCAEKINHKGNNHL